METKVSVETTDKPRDKVVKRRGGRERFPWQRLTLSLIGLIIVVGMWRWATFHLYSLPPQSIAAFTTITINSQYVIGALVIFFVTGRLIYEWKNETVSHVVTEGRNLLEKRDEQVTHDITERIIEEGAPGAPARRPFAPENHEEER